MSERCMESRRGSLRWLVTGLLLVLAFAAATVIHLTAPSADEAQAAAPPPLLEVRTAQLIPTPVPNTVEISGFLRPRRTVLLAMEESGHVAEKPLEEGATVEAGDLLVGLDTSFIEAELEQAEATLTEAEETLSLARLRLERASALSGGAISDDELDGRRSSHSVAEALLSSRRAARDMLAVRRDRHHLRAPMAGVISTLDIEVGSHIGVGEVIGRLDEVSVLEIELAVAPEIREALNVGDVVELWPDTDRSRVDIGRVSRLADVADDLSRKFDVEVQIDNSDAALLAGAPVRCRLQVGPPREALLIPEEWTLSRADVRAVYRVARAPDQPLRAIFTPIQARRLRQAPGRLEVEGNLRAGDELVIERLTELADGQEIITRQSVAMGAAEGS